jgi:hypothetical protein
MNTTVVLNGNGANTYTWNNGSFTNNTAFVATSNATYTVIGTDTVGCVGIDSITVVVLPNSNVLSQTMNNNTSSISGTSCSFLYQLDGSVLDYSDSNCNLIATIQDANGGNILGDVEVCVEVANTMPVQVGQPYLGRIYTITPTNQGAANITLYYTQDDLIDFNSYITNNSLTWPSIILPNNPQNGDSIKNLCIYKYENGGFGVGTLDSVFSVVLFYNSSLNRWETTFGVPSFSTFYCSVCNPNAPTPISWLAFTAQKNKLHTQLNWKVNGDEETVQYDVQRRNVLTPNFETIHKTTKKVNNDNYEFLDTEPYFGVNFYRIAAIQQDGTISYSSIEKISFENNTEFFVYPNPVISEVKLLIGVELSQDVKVKIVDATGRLVKMITTRVEKGINNVTINGNDLSSGSYIIQVETQTDNKLLSKEFVKF